jgi:hypothetical protein
VRASERIHGAVLIAFAALLGTVEGPAEIACALAIGAGLFAIPDKRLALDLPVIGFLVWALAGIPGAFVATSPLEMEDVCRPLLGLGFVVGARSIAHLDDRRLAQLAWAFGLACVLNGSYGYLQLWLGELPLDRWLLKNPRSPQIFVPDHVFWTRGVSGLFYNRLKLAHVGIVALALIALIAAQKPRPSNRLLALLVAGFSVLGGAVVLTYARAAWVAFLVAIVATLSLGTKKRWALVGAASVLALSLLAFLLPFGRERISSLMPDLEMRSELFVAALRIFREHPILGIGHGVYRTISPSVLPPTFGGVLVTSPHNLFLQVLAETGAVGFAGFITGLIACLWRSARRIVAARADAGPHAVLDRLAFFTLLAFSLLGLSHFTLHHAPVALVFWTLAGVAGRPNSQDQASPITG